LKEVLKKVGTTNLGRHVKTPASESETANQTSVHGGAGNAKFFFIALFYSFFKCSIN
jgi:hypothetical protein